MHLPSHLRLSRCGVYQFRLVLPEALARALGQKEFRRSLGTKRPEGAKLLAYGLSARMLPLIRTMSRAMAFDPNSIDPETARKLIFDNLVIDAGGLKASRVQTSDDPAVARMELLLLKQMAREAAGLSDGPPAEGEAYEQALREQRELLEATAKPAAPDRPKKIKDAIAGFLRFKKASAPATLGLYKRRLNVFAQLAGGEERQLHHITEADCAEIVEALNVLPTHRAEVGTATSLLAAPPEGRTLSVGTINDHLTLFKAFFGWSIRSKHYLGSNPFADPAKPTKTAEEGGAEAFTQSELERIFDPALFADMKRPYHFWGPLLGLHTGARSNELAQLRLCDLVEEGGVKCLSIEHDPDDETPTRTKNKASRRLLPIHAQLWEIGLQAYLDDLKATGADRLFPTLPLDVHGKREKYFSRDFNELHLKNLGIWQKRRKVFHSFRDTATEAMAEAEVDTFLIEQWIGHAHETVMRTHYRKTVGPEKLSAKCWPAFKFPFLRLDEIRYEKGKWNEWMLRNLKP